MSAINRYTRGAPALLLALTLGCSRHADVHGVQAAQSVTVPGALANMHLVSEVSTGEWRMPAGDYGNLRYSTLDTINTTNVMNLRVMTTFSTGIPHGHEGQPLVVGDTMYVVTPFPNNLIAVDRAPSASPAAMW
jgi:glucose dehydrogenase